MGVVVTFPVWRVEARVRGAAPYDPQALVDPRGHRIPIIEVLRRRLIASPDPRAAMLHEVLVSTVGNGLFLLRWREGEDRWQVTPL